MVLDGEADGLDVCFGLWSPMISMFRTNPAM